jgi:phytanoyl-CoA hydroxylase
VIKHLLAPELLKVYRDRFVALANGEVARPPLMTVMRDVSISKKKDVKGEDYISKVQDYEDDEVLFTYCQREEVLRYIRCFCGPDVKSIHTMLINKPPYAGATGRHPLHQDLHYFPFRPANRIACSWTALEPVSKANGCLVVLPGTHKGQLLEHGYPDWEGAQNAMYHGVKNIDPAAMERRVYVEMDPGDTVFFHPILIHGSGANKTAGFRKAISCHYSSAHAQFIDISHTTQATIAAEFEAIREKLFPGATDFRYEDLWKMKARLVSGVEGTL